MHNLDSSRGDEAKRAFKQIRNGVRRFYPKEIVFECISKLMAPHSNRIEVMRRYTPWSLLLLIRWAVVYGKHGIPRRRLTPYDFDQLVGGISRLADTFDTPTDSRSLFLYMRKMAFQQFWLQEPVSLPRLSRQRIMFGCLPPDHPFHQQFQDQVGIAIEHFIQLSMALLVRFVQHPHAFVTKDWFRTIGSGYPQGTVQSYLDALSLDWGKLFGFLCLQQKQVRSVPYQFFGRTPLRRYPLLRSDDRYYCYSRNLLYHTLHAFVHDTLRSRDPEAFMKSFGTPLFERYVEESLSYTGIPLLTESDLQHHLGDRRKIVDFLLVDADTNIFVDAKGVEMSPLGMVSADPEIIRNKTRDSILKGITQAFEAAQGLAPISPIKGIPLGTSDPFLLIITFEDLYVGNGEYLYQYIAQAKLDDLVTQNGGKHWIPFENMYFISIDDLDYLVSCISSGSAGLAQILTKAVEADKEPGSRKFTFRQHLWEFFPQTKPPKFLLAELESVAQDMKGFFVK